MFSLLLICMGDMELNPDPRKNNMSYNFSFCHWNLNSIAACCVKGYELIKAHNSSNSKKLNDSKHLSMAKNSINPASSC